MVAVVVFRRCGGGPLVAEAGSLLARVLAGVGFGVACVAGARAVDVARQDEVEEGAEGGEAGCWEKLGN